jgi:hypothetical protein
MDEAMVFAKVFGMGMGEVNLFWLRFGIRANPSDWSVARGYGDAFLFCTIQPLLLLFTSANS